MCLIVRYRRGELPWGGDGDRTGGCGRMEWYYNRHWIFLEKPNLEKRDGD